MNLLFLLRSLWMKNINKIGFGGGCHWCTEAVFQFLKGVTKVEQGFIASTGENSGFSEAVIVHFNPIAIPLEILIEIHLLTHNSTSNHSFRKKYRSAVYFFNAEEESTIKKILQEKQQDFQEELITQVLDFQKFKPSAEEFQNYYLNDPEKPFCQRYIHPKLNLLKEKFLLNTSKG